VTDTPVPAATITARLAHNYPPDALEWVGQARWTGPQDVPLSRLDFDDTDKWAAHHEQARVAHFANRMRAGRHVNPAVVVVEPDDRRAIVIDGHHRALAARQLGRPLHAYVGHVNRAGGPWTSTHLYQRHSGADPMNKAGGWIAAVAGTLGKVSKPWEDEPRDRHGRWTLLGAALHALGAISDDDMDRHFGKTVYRRDIGDTHRVTGHDTGRVVLSHQHDDGTRPLWTFTPDEANRYAADVDNMYNQSGQGDDEPDEAAGEAWTDLLDDTSTSGAGPWAGHDYEGNVHIVVPGIHDENDPTSHDMISDLDAWDLNAALGNAAWEAEQADEARREREAEQAAQDAQAEQDAAEEAAGNQFGSDRWWASHGQELDSGVTVATGPDGTVGLRDTDGTVVRIPPGDVADLRAAIDQLQTSYWEDPPPGPGEGGVQLDQADIGDGLYADIYRDGTVSIAPYAGGEWVALTIDDLEGLGDHLDAGPVVKAASRPVAAGIAVRAADTGRILMLQRAHNPTHCTCGTPVEWDDQNGYQHADGSVSHDDGTSVSDRLGARDKAAGFWELPGGRLEAGEGAWQAGRREWEEETGLRLPPGEVTGRWRSPDGIYHGFVHTTPTETAVPIHDGRGQVSNPDDPDGDHIEALAWWDPKHLKDNPAVRPELLATRKRLRNALDPR